ncbi:protein of unknown function [Moritella yayanosii]|uniref:Uncharacterized protein n=1 Tax=Moritella yayanosii TaxID=69539 RepID=A0A330LLZ8_9GAMM|nr:protein of unknown function [Moritella yayanosii]
MPFVENIKVSHLKFAYGHQNQIATDKQAADLLSKAYRVYQFINPAAAIARTTGTLTYCRDRTNQCR